MAEPFRDRFRRFLERLPGRPRQFELGRKCGHEGFKVRHRLYDAGPQDRDVPDVLLQPVRLCGRSEGVLRIEVGDGVVSLPEGRRLHLAVSAEISLGDFYVDGIRHLRLPSG